MGIYDVTKIQIYRYIGSRGLTWRLAMLLALALAHRASELTLLHMDVTHVFKSADFWRFICFLTLTCYKSVFTHMICFALNNRLE